MSRFLVTFLSTEGNSLFLNLSPDWRLLGFTAGLAILTCILFGLAPALRAASIAPAEAMKAGSRGLTASRERFGLRRSLVASQVALSQVLLVGAVLFSRSLLTLLASNPGFQENGILVADVDFSRLNLPSKRRLTFKRELLERLGAIPGVESVAEASSIPVSGSGIDNTVWTDGSDRRHGLESNFNWISRDYFRTLGIPLLKGREFDDRDTPTSPKVAIINETFARKLGLGANPLGARFRREATPSEPEAVFEIVGLVKDTKYRDIRESFTPIAFLSTSQDSSPDPFAQILIRADAPMVDLTARLRRGMTKIGPEITTVYWPFKAMIREKLLPERLMAALSGFFGLLAGLLAAIGIYGVVSYMVAQRRNEIGIRMALGAEQQDVLWMVLREILWLVLIGVLIGLPCALASARLASSLLFGVKPHDPATIGLATLAMIGMGLVSGYMPARRASHVVPMVALRHE